jgi:hypothetical protein
MVRWGPLLIALGVLFGLAGSSAWADNATPPPLPAPATQVTPPPLPPPEPAVQFFVAENGRPVGPLSLDQMRARIQGSQTKRSDLVWKAGSPAWLPADQVAELRDAFGTAPPDVPQEAKLQEFMVGIWEASGSSPQGFDWALRISYTADGRYSGYQTLTMNGTTTQQAAAGKWTVTSAGQNKFSLNLTPQGGMAVTAVLTVIDQNTLFNEPEGYYAKRIGR